MRLEFVISGGQTGVDAAALRAAHAAGLRTGGFAPMGWRTLSGAAPELRNYGLRELRGGYAHRTWENVRSSDATLRLARIWTSTGEQCTLAAIRAYQKPTLAVPLQVGAYHPDDILRFLRDENVRVLNVAGNSEQTSPGIGDVAEELLRDVFTQLGRA